MELFKIGFFSVRLVDVLDIAIVSFLLFKMFEVLRESIMWRVAGFAVAIFILWKLVVVLDLLVLQAILDRFLGLGTLSLVILFTPEIRRLSANFIQNINIQQLLLRTENEQFDLEKMVSEFHKAISVIQNKNLGALFVFCAGREIFEMIPVRDDLKVEMSADFILAVFQKESPLHDGAMIIQDGKIRAVRAILPITANSSLPTELGTRHRAALGIAELTDVLAVVVSEERGQLSCAYKNKLYQNCEKEEIENYIRKVFSN